MKTVAWPWLLSPCSITLSHYWNAHPTQLSTLRVVFLVFSCFSGECCSCGCHSIFHKVCGLSGVVTDTSEAAVLPMTQLGINTSAGWVLLWLEVRLLPTSTRTPMWAWQHTSTIQSQSQLCLVTASPPHLHVTA